MTTTLELPVPAQAHAPERDLGRLLIVHAVAELLACSTRQVRRLVDAGKMPRPLKIGGMIRWRRQELDDWLAAGCPPVGGCNHEEPAIEPSTQGTSQA